MCCCDAAITTALRCYMGGWHLPCMEGWPATFSCSWLPPVRVASATGVVPLLADKGTSCDSAWQNHIATACFPAPLNRLMPSMNGCHPVSPHELHVSASLPSTAAIATWVAGTSHAKSKSHSGCFAHSSAPHTFAHVTHATSIPAHRDRLVNASAVPLVDGWGRVAVACWCCQPAD